MSIVAITGLPGSGKTYSVLEMVILPAMVVGRPVVTNIPIKFDVVKKHYPNADISLIDTKNIHHEPDFWKENVPGGSILVLDELGMLWPSGLLASQAHASDKELIQMHRHRVGKVGDQYLSTEIVLVCQSTKDISMFVRAKIDKTYVVKKLSAVGLEGYFTVSVFEGAQDTQEPKMSQRITGYKGKYQPKVFQYYKSHSQSDSEAAVSVHELRAEKKSTIFSSFGFRIGLVSVLLLPLLAGFLGKKSLEGISQSAEKNKELTGTDLSPPGGSSVLTKNTSSPSGSEKSGSASKRSDHWAIIASLESADRRMLSLESLSGRIRIVTEPVPCIGSGDSLLCEVDGETVGFFTGPRHPLAVGRVDTLPAQAVENLVPVSQPKPENKPYLMQVPTLGQVR